MLGLVASGCGPSESPRPHIVFVLIDTLRRDHVGAYGYERDTTPFIDSLAAKGLLFEDAVAQAPWTAASMASLWTSLLPSEAGGVVLPDDDGIRNLGTTPLLRMRADPPTLAGRLSAGGYLTIAGIANAYAGSAIGLLRGFASVLEKPLDARGLTDAAVEHLSRHFESEQARPVFLYLHFRDAHEPTFPPEPYRSLFAAADGEPHANEHARWRHGDRQDLEADDVRAFRSHKIALYDGALRFVDEQLRRLAEELEKLGVLDRTVFVIASDHGEEFWDHARLGGHLHVDPRGIAGIGHGHTLFGELLDVPLILSGAGLPAQRVREQVRNLDLAPTLLGLAGLPADTPGWRGIDLLAAIEAGELVPLDAFSESIAYGPEARSLEDARHKLIHYERTRDGSTELLFDRSADPDEQRDLRSDRPAELAAMREKLGAIRRGTAPMEGDHVEIDESMRARLRELGYLETEAP